MSICHLGGERLEEGPEGVGELGDFSGGGGLLCSGDNVREELGIESVVGKERADSKGFGDGVVVGELSEGQEHAPIVLLIIHTETEVLFHDGVDSFGRAIGLGVKRGTKLGLNFEGGAQ